MSVIKRLLDGGPDHEVSLSKGGASLRPRGDTDAQLDAFQAIADEAIRHDGEGYTILLDHRSSDRPGNLIDLIIMQLD